MLRPTRLVFVALQQFELLCSVFNGSTICTAFQTLDRCTSVWLRDWLQHLLRSVVLQSPMYLGGKHCSSSVLGVLKSTVPTHAQGVSSSG